MKPLENLEQKKELLIRLEHVKEIIGRNSKANLRLDSLQKELTKTNIEMWFIFLGIIVGLIAGPIITSISIFFLIDYDDFETIFPIIFFVILLGLIVTPIVIFIKLGKKRKESIIRKRFEERKNEIDELNSVILKTFEELEKVSVLPKKYQNINTIEKIQEYLINNRADSLKEALNLYEDEMMKLHQVEVLNQISQQQKDLIEAQRAIKRELSWQTILISMKK